MKRLNELYDDDKICKYFTDGNGDEDYKTLRNMYLLLNKNDDEYKKFCDIILSHHNANILRQCMSHQIILFEICRYLEILTMRFPDGKELQCCKILLVTKSQYFRGMLDCGDKMNTNSIIYLDTNFETTKILIESLYMPNLENKLTCSNAIELLQIMDQFLIRDNVGIILKYLWNSNNIFAIIEEKLKIFDITYFTMLEIILNNITHDECIDNCTKNGASLISQKIFANIGNKINNIATDELNIFLFERWVNLFTEDQKMGAIVLAKKYELWDKSGICPKKIIKFLIENDITHDLYNEIANELNNPLTQIYVNPSQCESINDTLIIIKSYYPIFKYDKLTKVRFAWFDETERTWFKNDTNKLIIQFDSIKWKKISVNDKIILGKTFPHNSENIIIVTNITKSINKRRQNVKDVLYYDNTIVKVMYELTFNKLITSADVDKEWFIEEVFIHKVTL